MHRQNNNTKINYVSELTGTGKTNHFINKTLQNTTGSFLVVVPNRELCDEIFENYKKHANRITQSESEYDEYIKSICVIHQNSVDSPSKRLKHELRKKNHRIVITTHASFLKGITIYPKIMSKWELIIDEEINIIHEHEIDVTDVSKQTLHNLISMDQNYPFMDEIKQVLPKNQLLANNVASGQISDDILSTRKIRDLCQYLTSPIYTTVTSDEYYEKFKVVNEQKEDDLSGKKVSKFYSMSILNIKVLSQFKNVTIISSFFERTISYHMLKTFYKCDMIRKELPNAYKSHPNSRLVNIHYFFEKNWTKTLRTKKVEHGKTVEDMVCTTIMSIIGDQKYLYNANVGSRDKFKNGVLASSIHGVNKYIHYKNLVFLPSLNANNYLVNLLKKFGLQRKDIDFSRSVLSSYQFVSRGAIRNYRNEDQINLIVMDKRSADFLKSIFKEAKIKHHELDIENKANRYKINNKIKSFKCRVERRMNNGETIREATRQKYIEIMNDYYDVKIKA